MKAAEKRALECNIKKIKLECFETNKQGINFYVKNLYKRVGKLDKKIVFEKILKKDINPLVSICCATYNQSKYITDCLEGFINQKVNFDFEILIHDDASFDCSAKIIRKYEEKYPNIIKAIYQLENQYSKGISISKTFQFPRALGKYIALCEGDDYWCDENKLQKQVDFMEKNPDYALCYHPAKMVYVEEKHKPVILGKSKYQNPQPYYNLLKANYIPANSIMYRAKYLKEELNNYPDDIYPPDWFSHISVARHGKIGYLPDVMYVYRWNKQGISYTESENPETDIHLKYGVKEANFYYYVWQKVKDIFPQYYKEMFLPKTYNICLDLLKNGQIDNLLTILNKYSSYLKDFKLKEKRDKNLKKYKKYKRLFNIFLIISCILFLICTIFIILYYK